jgi:Na+/H+-dicarboxylate symporter
VFAWESISVVLQLKDGRAELVDTFLVPPPSRGEGAMENKSRLDDLSTPPGTPSGPSQYYNNDSDFAYKYPDSMTPSLKSEKRVADPMMEAIQGDLKGGNENPATMFISLYNQRSSTPIKFVLAAAGVGIGLGVLFSYLQLDGNYAEWISMPGDLFIAALKCLIGPMVFCSIVGCIGQLVEAGKAASIGGRVMSYFALCSVISSAIGVLFGVLFSPFFIEQMEGDDSESVTELRVHCWNGDVLSMLNGGSMACVKDTNATQLAGILSLNDTSSNFATATETFSEIDVSQQFFAILKEIIPSNIIKAFSSSSTMGVITLAIFFGIAAVMSHERTRRQIAASSGPAGTSKSDVEVNHLLLLINHGGLLCQLMINAVVTLIPFAIVSMIAGSMAKYSSSMDLVVSVGFLIVALALALLTLMYGVMGTALFLTTRVNVFKYLRHIIPAQVFIFGCSSSIATLPMTMRCVDSTREVSYALSRFLLPLGATSNLNGSACYMTLACVFMAKVGGYGDMLTPLRYALLVLVGAIASFGVAPVPHSGLVMAITVWHTVFNMDVPPVFPLLVGADWLLNRMRAVVNITNDTILLRIIADQCDETTITELELEGQPTHLA